VIGAGALVAVAASGGGGGSGSSGSSGSGGSGGGTSAPGGGTTTNTLTGRWVGNAANGGGLTGVISLEGVNCMVQWDLTTDLVQSGTALTGTGTSVGRGASCSVPLPPEINAIINGQTGSGSLSGSASNGSLSFRVGELAFTGTYTSTRLDATAPLVVEGLTINYTWRQTKQ